MTLCNPFLHIKQALLFELNLSWVKTTKARKCSGKKSTGKTPDSCSLLYLLWNMRAAISSPSFPSGKTILFFWIYLRYTSYMTELHEYPRLPSLKGVFGGIFSLLSCWNALEGSKCLMPWIVYSCSCRSLFVCFSFARSARSFEMSWRKQYSEVRLKKEGKMPLYIVYPTPTDALAVLETDDLL